MFLFDPLLVLVFTLSQSVRDVYFGSVFQRLDFFLVILLAFSWSTVIFAATTLIRAPSDFAIYPPMAIRGCACSTHAPFRAWLGP
jgi:hypothetical protein